MELACEVATTVAAVATTVVEGTTGEGATTAAEDITAAAVTTTEEHWRAHMKDAGIFSQAWLPEGMSAAVPEDATTVKVVTGPPPGYAGGRPSATAGLGATMTGPCPYPNLSAVLRQIMIAPTSFTSAPYWGLQMWKQLLPQAYGMGGECSVSDMLYALLEGIKDAGADPVWGSGPIHEAWGAVWGATETFLRGKQLSTGRKASATVVRTSPRPAAARTATMVSAPGYPHLAHQASAHAGFGATPFGFNKFLRRAGLPPEIRVSSGRALRGCGCR
jgi:hypothetical protein